MAKKDEGRRPDADLLEDAGTEPGRTRGKADGEDFDGKREQERGAPARGAAVRPPAGDESTRPGEFEHT